VEQDARYSQCRLVAPWFVALCLSAGSVLGCAESWRLREDALPPEDPSRPLTEATVREHAAAPAGGTSEDPLAHDSWARRIAIGESAATRHWRHVELESADGALLIDEHDLSEALRSEEKLVAINARLLLLRAGAAAGNERAEQWLAEIVADRGLSAPLRAAAVETLAELNSSPARDAFRSLLVRHATFPTEVRVELFRRGAETFGPTSGAEFIHALGDNAVDVRIAGVEAWRTAAPAEAPPQLADLVNDLDPRVRAATVRTLADIGGASALDAAARCFRDPQLEVRLAAIEALGKIQHARALELLHQAAGEEGNKIRAAAVTALAAQGDAAAVVTAVEDNDAAVRTAAAKALPKLDSAQGRALARALIADRSMAVRRAAIESIASWPAVDAVPLLLNALDDRAMDTRKSAQEALATIWPRAAEFRPAADADTRATLLAALRQEWQVEHGGTALAAATFQAATPTPGTTTPLTDAQLDALLTTLADNWSDNDPEAIAALGATDSQFEARLLEWADRSGRELPAALVDELLTPRNQVLRQLADWDTLAPRAQRQLASSLAQQAIEHPLTPLATRRYLELAQLSDDPLVWQSALDACRTSPDESVRRFAAAALGHPAPEVRRRACEFFAAQPANDAVRWLTPVLRDPTSYVAAAAARAIGRCGRMDDWEQLAALCGHHDAECRLAAAETLAAWDDQRGLAALERLAYERDPAIRIRAVEAMGRVGAREFTATLVALLDDELGVRRAVLASLPAVTGESVATSDEATAPAMAEQVARWKRWAAARD